MSSEGVLSFAAAEGDDEVAWFDRAGNLAGALRGLERLTDGFNLSPDGRSLAYESREDIWLYDVERQVSTRFTSSPGREGSPIWSPDGRALYYFTLRRSGSAGREVTALYRKPVSGMNTEEEVLTDHGNSPGSMSPDGRFLAFVRPVEGVRKLWVLPDPGGPSATSQPYQLFRDSSGDATQPALIADYDPAWSPDGRWLAFGSNETGGGEVYVVPFPGPGARVRVSRAGANTGAGLHFSQDGKQILFVDGGQRLVAVDISVVSGQLQVGDSHALFPVTGRFDMSPDGRRFLVSGRRSNEPLTIVQNWTAMLRKP